MYGPPLPDLSVQVTRRRCRCILDPNLALSRDGAMLARLLAPYAEQWVGPELFNILDSAQLYQQEPELLIWPSTNRCDAATVPEVLRDWNRLRDEAGRCFYWVGDALRESFLPEDVDDAVLGRWEAASRTLDQRLPKAIEGVGPMIAAMRDAAALCAVLPNARIVARSAGDDPPPLCRHLDQWGLACQKLADDDPFAGIERAAFQQLLVAAGLAPLLWRGLRLAVAHLSIPHLGRLDPPLDLDSDDIAAADPSNLMPGNPWEEARCFWYDIAAPAC